MTASGIEIHLSNFKYIQGTINRDLKLRFDLSFLIYMEQGEPIGMTMEGCIAYVTKSDTLAWHPPMMVKRGIYLQPIKVFKRLYDAVLEILAGTKHAQKLKRNILSFFEKLPSEVDETLKDETEITVKIKS